MSDEIADEDWDELFRRVRARYEVSGGAAPEQEARPGNSAQREALERPGLDAGLLEGDDPVSAAGWPRWPSEWGAEERGHAADRRSQCQDCLGEGVLELDSDGVHSEEACARCEGTGQAGIDIDPTPMTPAEVAAVAEPGEERWWEPGYDDDALDIDETDDAEVDSGVSPDAESATQASGDFTDSTDDAAATTTGADSSTEADGTGSSEASGSRTA